MSLLIAIFITLFIIIFIIKVFNRFVAISEYRLCYIDIKNVIVFVILRMKEYYDTHHQSRFFNIDYLINFNLYRGYQILAIKFKKIDFQLIDLFRILDRIDRSIYRLKLFDNMSIYDVIFIAHLKSAIDLIKDFY